MPSIIFDAKISAGIYTHTHTHIHTHTYTHTHTHTHTHTYICVCVCVCIYIYAVLDKILCKSIQNTNTNTWKKYFKCKYKYQCLKVFKILIVLKNYLKY